MYLKQIYLNWKTKNSDQSITYTSKNCMTKIYLLFDHFLKSKYYVYKQKSPKKQRLKQHLFLHLTCTMFENV